MSTPAKCGLDPHPGGIGGDPVTGNSGAHESLKGKYMSSQSLVAMPAGPPPGLPDRRPVAAVLIAGRRLRPRMPQAPDPETVVARVGGQPITERDIALASADLAEQFAQVPEASRKRGSSQRADRHQVARPPGGGRRHGRGQGLQGPYGASARPGACTTPFSRSTRSRRSPTRKSRHATTRKSPLRRRARKSAPATSSSRPRTRPRRSSPNSTPARTSPKSPRKSRPDRPVPRAAT